MRPWSLAILCLLVASFEGAALAALGTSDWALQTPVALVIYIGLRRDFVEGCLLTAALFIPLEWLAHGPMGVYSSASAILFFIAQLTKRRIQRDFGLSHILLGAALLALHQFIVLVLLTIWQHDSPLVPAVAFTFLPSLLLATASFAALGFLIERLGRSSDAQSRISID